MKKIAILSTIILSLFLSSCKSDDDSSSSNRRFTYNNTNYNVSYVVENKYSNGDASITFLNNINYNGSTNTFSAESANFLEFDFQFNSEVTTIPEGTYTFNADDATVNTFYGEVTLGYNSENDTEDLYDSITSGTVIVSKSGSTYTFDFDVATQNGETVSGTITSQIDVTYN